MDQDAYSSTETRTVFEYWQMRMGSPRSKLDQKRRRKIKQRLLDGYSAQDLIDAIEGCALSDFHMGKNDRSSVYNDIELICRDACHVDKFISLRTKIETEKKRAAHNAKQQAEYVERKRQEFRDAGRHLKVAT